MKPGESWTLDRRSWDGLLAFLGRDGVAPGEAYEALREKLEAFFRWRGLGGARELADETLDRIAKKLEAGEEIETTPTRFALGVARFVALEAQRKSQREQPELVEAEAPPPPAGDERVEGLVRCLERLPPADRSLLLRYHEESRGQPRISRRERLAKELGIELNALRVRAFRIRGRLERCLGATLGEIKAKPLSQ